MNVDKRLLDSLTEQAKSNSRLRQNYDLRNSPDDQSQRMLNALELGTVIPIHRHIKSSESTAVIRGSIRQNFYDGNGMLVEQVVIKAADDCPIYVVPKGMWHNTECLENGTILFEAKDGPYEPMPEVEIWCNVLRARIAELKTAETRSCSMEPNLFTPEYVWRMWSEQVPLELIVEAMKEM